MEDYEEQFTNVFSALDEFVINYEQISSDAEDEITEVRSSRGSRFEIDTAEVGKAFQ